jgi:hypothetical protein
MKLNGVLVSLERTASDATGSTATFRAAGVTVTVRALDDGLLAEGESEDPAEAELVFELQQGLRVGYRGSYGCGTR